MTDIYKRLMQLLELRKTNLYQLARASDVPYTSIRGIEKSIPNVIMAIRLADALSVPVEYLAMGRESIDLSNEEVNLLKIFRGLSPTDKETLLEMADVFRKKTKPKASETSDNLNEKLSSLTVN